MSNVLYGLDATATESVNDFVMAKSIADALNAHYPKHLWAVSVDGERKRVEIRNLLLSGKMGFVLKLDKMYSISSLIHDAKMGAGEILERYRLRVGAFDEAQYSTKSTDFAGRFAFDK